MNLQIKPIPPFIDGYKSSDEIIVPLVNDWRESKSNHPSGFFSASKKTCYVYYDYYETDTFRQKDGLWIYLGSDSKQKWEVKVIDD